MGQRSELFRACRSGTLVGWVSAAVLFDDAWPEPPTEELDNYAGFHKKDISIVVHEYFL